MEASVVGIGDRVSATFKHNQTMSSPCSVSADTLPLSTRARDITRGWRGAMRSTYQLAMDTVFEGWIGMDRMDGWRDWR